MSLFHGSNRLPSFAAVVALFAALCVPAAPTLAAGTVSDCSNQTNLATAATGGGLVTFSCGTATIPMTSTITIFNNVTIDGGNSITIDGQNATRIFIVSAGTTLTLTNIVLTKGKAPDDPLTGGGAVIVNNTGNLVTNNASFIANKAYATSTSTGAGGAISGIAAATVKITGGIFQDNGANYGGATFADNPISVIGASFLNNRARFLGGAHDTNSSVAFVNTVFRGNVVTDTTFSDGGAIWAANTVTATGSTFDTNQTIHGDGGAISATNVIAFSSSFTGNSAQSSSGANGGAIAAKNAVTLTGSTVLSNTASYLGGGVAAPSLALIQSSLSGNSGIRGGGFSGTIFKASDSTVSGNEATFGAGGGVLALSAEFVRSTLSGNRSGSAVLEGGGGVYAGDVSISFSTVSGNFAPLGGGVVRATTANIVSSSFIGNSGTGGGVYATTLTIDSSTFAGNSGGPAARASSSMNVSSSTFSGNSGPALATGAATIANSTFFNNSGMFGSALDYSENSSISNSTVYSNSTPVFRNSDFSRDLTIKNTIIAGPAQPYCSGGSHTPQGKNIIQQDDSCGLFGSPINADPLLGSLQDNGGPTATMAPQTGSPAIGAGVGCLPNDQRGVLRVNPCDIGAYETGISPSITSISPNSATALDTAFTLNVSGSGFIAGTVVLWNGSPRPTTVNNPISLSAAIPASDLTASGTILIQVRFAAAADATSNELPFTIAKKSQSITFAQPPNRRVTESPFALNASASSGLPVQFNASGACTMTDATVTLTGTGTCTITAAQPGNETYAAASESRSFTVEPGFIFIAAAVSNAAIG